MTIIRNGYDAAKPIQTFYTVTEVADIAGKSRTTVRTDVMRGKIPFVLTGAVMGIPQDAVADYIAESANEKNKPTLSGYPRAGRIT